MIVTIKSWKKLFLFCIGLAASAAFCMKWMEPDLYANNGARFTIMGLELFYPKEQVILILANLSPSVQTILRYHLTFDFAFMAGVYPGIAALCIMAAVKSPIRKILFFLAILQLAAWIADIVENYYLLHWIGTDQLNNNFPDQFSFYRFVVIFKWVVALIGILISLAFIFRKKSNPAI